MCLHAYFISVSITDIYTICPVTAFDANFCPSRQKNINNLEGVKGRGVAYGKKKRYEAGLRTGSGSSEGRNPIFSAPREADHRF